MRAGDHVLEFIRLMWSVDHELQRVSRRMVGRIGLTAPQRLAVRFIGRNDGLTLGTLAGLLQAQTLNLEAELFKKMNQPGRAANSYDLIVAAEGMPQDGLQARDGQFIVGGRTPEAEGGGGLLALV